MTLAYGAYRLPVELVSMVMDHVDIQHLLVLSHVCGKWNSVARSHPLGLYWRNIRLAALTTSALDFFQARLDYGAERRINISICLADAPSCGRMRSVVLPAVSRNLSRVVQLCLDLHADLAPYAMSALSQPAPYLRSLGLSFFHCTNKRPAVLLSHDLFSGCCPSLVDLSLEDVSFPSHRIPAFERVDTLQFHFKHPRVFPSDLFDQFPGLHDLIITGDSCLEMEPPVKGSALVPADSLRKLEIYLSRSTHDPILFAMPSLASIVHIICRRPRDHVARLLIDHLAGPLELNFLCLLQRCINVAFYAPSSGRVRTLVEFEPRFLEDLPRAIVFSPGLLYRVELLRIFARLSYLAPHLEEMPSCRTLEIILEDTALPIPEVENGAPLCLPTLNTVVVGNGQERPTRDAYITVAARALHRYLLQLLRSRPARLSLRLHGVMLSGDNVSLLRDFDVA